MKSLCTWRIMCAAFGSALAVDALLAFAGGPDNVDGRCGAHVEDFSKFQVCFGYPAAAPSGIDCTLFDFDTNGIVNLADFAARTFVLRDRISVFPARVVITYSQQVDFDAVIAGSGNQSVQWVVMPVPGSEPGESLGTINANGLYSPPSPLNLHAASEVVVLATSQGGGGPGPASDFACVSLFGVLAARPPVSLVLPGSGDPGESPENVTVAQPPTVIVLPGEGDLDELPMNVTLAMPLVALVLPGVSEPDVFPPNVTVANPPVSVDFEDAP